MKKPSPEKEASRKRKKEAKRERKSAWEEADKAMMYIITGTAVLLGVAGTIFVQWIWGIP